ncbi:MAG: hldE, partial [Pseudonocardia sp.]|nr:hldE [Pseudonocardia sp.]
MRPLVVVGDCLLDTDLDGTSERLAPDAPVPVIDVHRSIDRPGGAGLAALLAARSGVPVVFVTALAADAAGRRVRELLDHELDVVPLRLDGGTVRKSRLRVDGKAVARLDSGTGVAVGPLPATARAALCAAGAVLVSDYGRGVTELPEIRSGLVDAARRVPVAWDPHPKG